MIPLLKRHPVLALVLVVDLLGLLILDIVLIAFLWSGTSGRWQQFHQEMVIAFAAAVVLDVFVLRLRRWAFFGRAAVAFVIAVGMVGALQRDKELLSPLIATWQILLLAICGWWMVRRSPA